MLTASDAAAAVSGAVANTAGPTAVTNDPAPAGPRPSARRPEPHLRLSTELFSAMDRFRSGGAEPDGGTRSGRLHTGAVTSLRADRVRTTTALNVAGGLQAGWATGDGQADVESSWAEAGARLAVTRRITIGSAFRLTRSPARGTWTDRSATEPFAEGANPGSTTPAAVASGIELFAVRQLSRRTEARLDWMYDRLTRDAGVEPGRNAALTATVTHTLSRRASLRTRITSRRTEVEGSPGSLHLQQVETEASFPLPFSTATVLTTGGAPGIVRRPTREDGRSSGQPDALTLVALHARVEHRFGRRVGVGLEYRRELAPVRDGGPLAAPPRLAGQLDVAVHSCVRASLRTSPSSEAVASRARSGERVMTAACMDYRLSPTAILYAEYLRDSYPVAGGMTAPEVTSRRFGRQSLRVGMRLNLGEPASGTVASSRVR